MRAFPLFLLSLLLSFISGCNQNLLQSLSYYPQATPPSSGNSGIPMLLVMTTVGIGEYVLDNGLITNASPSNYTTLDTTLKPTAFTLSPTLPYLYLAIKNPSNEIGQFSLDATTGLPIALSLGGTTAVSGIPIAIAITPNNALAFVLNNSDPNSNFIDICTIDSTTGALTSVGGASVTSPGGLIITPNNLIISADLQSLYVGAFATDGASNNENFIAPFSISGTTLTQGTSVFVSSYTSGDIGAMVIATTPSGNNILYVAETQTTNIGIFLITSGGALIPQTGFTPPVNTLNIVIPTGGSYLYALGSDNAIYSYAIDPQTGALSAITSYSGTFAAIGLAADSKYLYATDSSSQLYTYSFTVNNDGTLTQADTLLAECRNPNLQTPSPILTSNVVSFTYAMCSNINSIEFIRAFRNTSDILSLPNYQPIISLEGNAVIKTALSSENNLYTIVNVQNGGSGTAIYQMALNPATGALSTLAPAISIADTPLSATLFNSEYLYLLGATNFYQYNVAGNGILTGGIPILSTGGFNAIFLASTSSLPQGSYLYALTSDSSNPIYQFSIDASSGTLTPLTPPTPGGVTTSGPTKMIIPANQTLVYLADGSSSFMALSIDPTSGQLSPNGASFSLPQSFYDFTVTPTLSFAYVIGTDLNIYQFAIDSSGALSALTPATVSTGLNGRVNQGSLAASTANVFYLVLTDGEIWEYAIGNDGQLSFVSSVPSEQNPSFILIVP